MSRAATVLPLAWQAQSVLLCYPDEELPGRRRHLTQQPDLAADYVATFDHRKRCCLFLTYYSYGDTRKRGMALLRLKQSYAAAGLHLTPDELPDHLAVVLEYAATAGPKAGKDLLQQHRAGLELLRLALDEAASPWADVLESVSATLPPLLGDQRRAVARLAAQGPPEEQVGLAPFAPPEYMPQPRGGPR